MFIVENKSFHVTRGDRGSVRISFKDYTFQTGDEIAFNIYEEDGMDIEPILHKVKTITASSATALIEFTASDTKLGEPSNERQTYWYEIVLNDDQTPFCYDKNGPKLFYLYPGGVD